MEIQRKIVESKNPPSNREVWWFDINTEVLKRYIGNAWAPINQDEKDVEEYDNNWLIMYTLQDETDRTANLLSIDIGGLASGHPSENPFTSNIKDKKLQDIAIISGPSHIALKEHLNFGSLNTVMLGNHIKKLGKFSKTTINTIVFPDYLKEYEPNSIAQSHKEVVINAGGKWVIDDAYLVRNNELVYTANGHWNPDWNSNYVNLPEVTTIKPYGVSCLLRYEINDEIDGNYYLGHIVRIPSSVKNIEPLAFNNSCRGIEKFIKEGESTYMLIQDGRLIAYAGLCPNTEVTIPDGIETVESSAFNTASFVEQIHVPSSVKTLETNCFYAPNLTAIYFASKIPPVMQQGSYTFGNNTNLKIYVPMDAVNTYKNASNWSVWSEKIVGYNF